MTECDEIVIVMDNVSTKTANTIATKKINTLATRITSTTATNVTSTTSINYHSKKVRECYIFHTAVLVIILRLIITTICSYYPKTKMYNIKWKIIYFKKFVLKMVHLVISMTLLN